MQNTLVIIKEHNDPIAQKLLTWIYATSTDMDLRAPDLIAFIKNNPDWPRQQAMREKIEKNIAVTVSSPNIIAWFQDNPPSTTNGIKAYVGALRAMGQDDEGRRQLKKFWLDKPVTKNDIAELAGIYSAWLTPADHAARLDTLIWQGRLPEAEYMLAFVSADVRALAQARMSLAKMEKKSDYYLSAVPASMKQDEGLLYERLRWRRRRQMDVEALQLVDQIPAVSKHAEEWWKELTILSRREIEKKNYSAAYRIARHHTLTDGIEYSQAEWLLGWLSLLQGNALQGYAHFEKMYNSVQSALSKSRGAYWAARAAEKMKSPPTEVARASLVDEQGLPIQQEGATARDSSSLTAQWYKTAAQYPSTFYGQLAYEKLYGDAPKSVMQSPAVDAATRQTFERREVVRAVRMLNKMNMPQFIDPFLARIINDAKTPADYQLAAELARSLDKLQYAVQANKDAQQKLGVFLFNEGYPTMSSLPLANPEKALVHAIVYRESMFNPTVSSSAGAMGMMQLMPGTAKGMAKHVGERYSAERLTRDPRYNIQLGSAYLEQLIDRYDGYYPLAIAAYNAGPGNVAEWLDELGDPRQPGVDAIDWVEHIPIYETRNYVQRVLEAYYVYRMRFGEKPRTISDFK